jgi:hypothetical protein
MEKAPENGKESSNSAHTNGMNEEMTFQNLSLLLNVFFLISENGQNQKQGDCVSESHNFVKALQCHNITSAQAEPCRQTVVSIHVSIQQ